MVHGNHYKAERLVRPEPHQALRKAKLTDCVVACSTRIGLYLLVCPLVFDTIRLETFTGSKSESLRLLRHARSLSFQRASGVPIRSPL